MTATAVFFLPKPLQIYRRVVTEPALKAKHQSDLDEVVIYAEKPLIQSRNGNVRFNRFAAPQGTVRSSVSMNLALQARLLNKKVVVTLNLIDPFFRQSTHTFTYGTNFALENYSSAQTRNSRLSLGYSFMKTVKKLLKKLTGRK